MKYKNQLFKVEPSKDLINKILVCFNLDNLEDNKIFSSLEMDLILTKSKFILLLDELKEIYIPCKYKIYFKDLDNYKNIITISRQILKTVNYTLNSKEKYKKGKKYLYYYLIYCDKKKIKKKYVLEFD
jgi:hypothetical protein